MGPRGCIGYKYKLLREAEYKYKLLSLVVDKLGEAQKGVSLESRRGTKRILACCAGIANGRLDASRVW